MTSERGYVVLTRGLDEPTARRSGPASPMARLAGLSLEPQPERRFPLAGGAPDSTLAAQLLGFVNREGAGQYGIEERYQAQLAGQPKIEQAVADATATRSRAPSSSSRPARPGRTSACPSTRASSSSSSRSSWPPGSRTGR